MRTRRQFFAALFAAPLVALGIQEAKAISLPQWLDVDEATRRDLEFYAGDQWPAGVKAKRLAQGRPCLVFNLLPGLVEASVARRRLTGAPFTSAEHRALILKAVRDCRDSQMMYNYFESAAAEAANSYRRIIG